MALSISCPVTFQFIFMLVRQSSVREEKEEKGKEREIERKVPVMVAPYHSLVDPLAV